MRRTVYPFTAVTTQGMCRCERKDDWKKNTSNIIEYENAHGEAQSSDCRGLRRIAAPILVFMG